MTRPCERFAEVDPAGEVPVDRGVFWVRTPWRFPPNRNLSAFEPNRLYLNAGDYRLLDVTLISGAGHRGDGRAALVADVNGDLHPDLIVRHAGGGSVCVFANRFPPAARLTVSLEGTKSNRLGIGARVVAEAGGRKLVRQLWSTNNFIGQQAPRVRFGLGSARTVDRLVVHWPSGHVQVLKGPIRTNRLLEIREGA